MLMNGAQPIRLNLSHAFFNKASKTGKKADMAYSFYPQEVKLTELVTHIVSGGAFTLGCFQSNHRIESAFVSSQLLGLDLDETPLDIEALEDQYPFIQEHCFLMYPSPSSTPEKPKTRVLFVLDEPVEDAGYWRALQLAMIEHFGELKPDTVCKDPARFFYGCQTMAYYVHYVQRLPVALAANLILPQAEREDFARTEARYVVRRQRDNTDELSTLVNKWFDTAIQRVSSKPAGERHKAFLDYALWLYGLNAGGWPITTDEIERAFLAISAQWGDKDQAAAKQSLKWAQSHASPISTEEARLTTRGKRASMLQRMSRWKEAG